MVRPKPSRVVLVHWPLVLAGPVAGGGGFAGGVWGGRVVGVCGSGGRGGLGRGVEMGRGGMARRAVVGEVRVGVSARGICGRGARVVIPELYLRYVAVCVQGLGGFL